MDHEKVAASLAELGNSHRLSVFRFLVKAGHDGASVGDIQKGLGIPASTLSHHLARMAKVGLIRQEKHRDRKSTPLNSSHVAISYAVFCLKKKTTTPIATRPQ